jgi:hypothetical protein
MLQPARAWPPKPFYSWSGCSGPVHAFSGFRWKTHPVDIQDELGISAETSTSPLFFYAF